MFEFTLIDVTTAADRLFSNAPAIVFSALGMLLILGAAGLAYRAIRLATGETMIGTIVGWHKRTSDDTISYAPIVRFHAGVAGEFEVQSSTVFEDEAGDVGVPVTVRYDPLNPERADIEERHHPWRPVMALLVLAAGAFAVGWKAGGY